MTPKEEPRTLPVISMHSLVGSKMRKQMSYQLQESAAAPTCPKAKKLLEKMGWSEGEGLGKRGDGIKTHIKAKRREDQAGLGTEQHAREKAAAADEWWKDSVGDTLAKLSSKKGKKKKKRHFTDEELFAATGGSRFGMRAAPSRGLAKWVRTNDEPHKKESLEEGAV
jgi:Pin2-interacting protein X1